MRLRTSDVVPISEARARLTELAEEVVGGGAEKVLTKNGASYVAIVDAKKLDYYHDLEQEHAGLVLLDEAYAFFTLPDIDSADSRLSKLKAELRELISVLSWFPGSGRPARFMAGRSAQARIRTEAVLRMSERAGLPFIRECVVAQHIVLYAHSDTEVMLLALKHQRQLTYYVS